MLDELNKFVPFGNNQIIVNKLINLLLMKKLQENNRRLPPCSHPKAPYEQYPL